MVGAGGGRLVIWSVFCILLVCGRFLFSQMIGGRCLNQTGIDNRPLRKRWRIRGGLSLM